MKLTHVARTNLRDAKTLGLGVLRRHVDARLGRPYTRLSVKGYGPVTIRPRTSDCRVVRSILGEGEYDLSYFPQQAVIDAAYHRILAAGRTPLILDLGANIGAASMWYARSYQRAHVVAVEPDPSNAALCRCNTAGLDVDVLTAAVGAEPGYVSLADSGSEKWAVTTARDERGRTPICLVNDIVRAIPDAELLIVKIDIEGFEADLFAANTEWARQAAVVVIEPHDWLLPGRATSRDFQRLFGSLDHDLLIRGENLVYVRRTPGAVAALGRRAVKPLAPHAPRSA